MRSRDRLAELRQIAEGNVVYNDTVEVLLDNGVKDDELNQMFREVEKIHGWIGAIEANSLLLRGIYADPTFHANKNLQEQLDSIITTSNATGLKVCGALRQFAAAAEATRFDARGRMARLQAAAARRRYADALTTHQQLLQMVQDGTSRLLHDQIRLLDLTITDEECESLLETNNIALFVDNVQAETASARLALRSVEQRRDELLRLEQGVREVHDLFLQMAHLVANQQELVDTVEYYATQASALVEAGGTSLHKGTVSRRKARNKKIGLALCLASGFLIVLFVLIAT